MSEASEFREGDMRNFLDKHSRETRMQLVGCEETTNLAILERPPEGIGFWGFVKLSRQIMHARACMSASY